MTGSRVHRYGNDQLADGGFPYSATVSPGPLVFTAGIAPLDEAGRLVGPGDLGVQVLRCLANLARILDGHGADFVDVAKLTVYLVDSQREDFAECWAGVVEAFGEKVPAAMIAGVTSLPYEGQLVEVEAVAAPPVG